MPTLIRLFVAVIVLGIFGFAGMVALTIFVDPGEKDITIKIPPRDLVGSSAPLDVNNLPDPVNVAPKEASSSRMSHRRRPGSGGWLSAAVHSRSIQQAIFSASAVSSFTS